MEEEKLCQAEEGEYKGRPTLTLHPYGTNGFTFGLKKAELILALYEDIAKFVDKHRGKKDG